MVSPVGERLPLGEDEGLPRWGRTPPVGKGAPGGEYDDLPRWGDRDSIPRWEVSMMISPGWERLPRWGV
jgi:hypothetical protein